MLTIKRATLLPINCYYGISVLAKNEAVLISIPRYMVFSVYCPTLLLITARHLKLYLPKPPSLFLANGFCVEMEAITDHLLC